MSIIKERTMESNIVKRDDFLPVLTDTLRMLADTIGVTAGPYGEQVIIDNSQPMMRSYTKDGHTVAQNIKVRGALEEHIRDQVVDTTTHIVRTVGDGTTSMAMMADTYSDRLLTFIDLNKIPMFAIKSAISTVMDDLQKVILAHAQEFTPLDAYDVAFTSTNGNKDLAVQIAEVYQQVGANCYINIEYSTNYEKLAFMNEAGISINAGYIDAAYKNTDYECVLDNPRIYLFEDPCTEAEMMNYFAQIIKRNIYDTKLYNTQSTKDPIPTVIMVPAMISRDLDDMLNNLRSAMVRNPGLIPLCIIKVPMVAADQYKDIITIFGNKRIRKFVTEEFHDTMVDQGVTPTLDNIDEWYNQIGGRVYVSEKKTRFTLPEDFDMSDVNAMIETYKAQLANLKKSTTTNAGEIAVMEERIHALQNNFATLYVSGLSNMLTESMKASLEDAVLNCRSCVEHGFGYGSMFEMFRAASYMSLRQKYEAGSLEEKLLTSVVLASITDAISRLYEMSGMDEYTIQDTLARNLENGRPINLRYMDYDDEHRVLTSIRTDYEIVNALKTVITDLCTARICLLETPNMNLYSKM